MQLVAYGAQDIYLTGNPQITFFKVVYRRHTNFSMEAIEQTFNGNAGLGESKLTSTISRNGDLVYKLWLDVVLKKDGIFTENNASNTLINWTNNTGHAFLKECEIEIGGQRIDRHYSQWLDIWNEVSDHDEEEWIGLNKNMSNYGLLKRITHVNWRHSQHIRTDMGVTTRNPGLNNLQLNIPLKFWFCRNPGLALPLIALQYHEVKIKVTTRAIDSLINMFTPKFSKSRLGRIHLENVDGQAHEGRRGAATAAPEVKLWADYIYLDTDERRRFAQVSHEYLIEQVQRNTQAKATVGSGNVKLNFNHPVKELLWVIQGDFLARESSDGIAGHYTDDGEPDGGINSILNGVPVDDHFSRQHDLIKADQSNDYFKYVVNGNIDAHKEYISGTLSSETFSNMKLKLNGHDRFKEKKASYFRTCQMIQSGHKVPKKHIYCYSFALKPEEHQPSGTCNFSRIDNAEMNFGSFGGVDDGSEGTRHGSGASTISVYAVNYNVLRIMSGMGGLAYSN